MELEFNGMVYNVKMKLDDNNIDLKECLNALNSDELFDYLYKYHIKLFNEINEDSYYEGKTIKSGEDLKNSIESITTIAVSDGVIYICGEYWCDPEHGFSITFPKGKFVKSKHKEYEYNQDQGKDVDYIPICTILGQDCDYL